MNKIYKVNDTEYSTYEEYREALRESDNRYNSYEPWADSEDKELELLSKTMSLPELADHFKRMKGGIRARLLKLSSSIATVCILLALTALTIQITQQPSGIVISNEAVDLHHAPASAAPKAGVARPGERAYIINQHNDFLKVETEAEITGWIRVDAFRKL